MAICSLKNKKDMLSTVWTEIYHHYFPCWLLFFWVFLFLICFYWFELIFLKISYEFGWHCFSFLGIKYRDSKITTGLSAVCWKKPYYFIYLFMYLFAVMLDKDKSVEESYLIFPITQSSICIYGKVRFHFCLLRKREWKYRLGTNFLKYVQI